MAGGKIIGITGGIGAGKSLITGEVIRRGYTVVDADEISRALTRKGAAGAEAIRKEFGEQYFQGGELNRRALAEKVFSNKKLLMQLNSVMHPLIIKQAKDELKEGGFISAPLLFETGLDELCDSVWLVTCGEKQRTERIVRRDGVTARHVRKRMRAQMSEREKRARADEIIDNSCDEYHAFEQLNALLKKYGDIK